MNEQDFLMHREGIEGNIFYKNLLTQPQLVKKYFPPTQNQKNYDNAPKIAMPLTSTFINKIANLIHNGMSINISNAGVDATWREISKRLNFNEVSRNIVVNTLIGGNDLIVLRSNQTNQVYLEEWRAPYVFNDGYFVGYEYILRDGIEMIPLVAEPKRLKSNEILVHVPIDVYLFGTEEHNLGYTPAVLFRSIDKNDDGLYGVPYHMRYRDLNIEYNHILSQISKAIKIMQNVWVTNSDAENPNSPLRLDPDTINFVGAEGKLEQAIRQLNTEPETSFSAGLLQHIHNAAQVPSFMSGLEGIGKIESGVALQIVSGPVIELCSRIRTEYKEDMLELITKIILTEFALNGVSAPTFDIELNLNENVLPIDKQSEIDNVLKLVSAGIVTPQQAQQIIFPLIGIVTDEI